VERLPYQSGLLHPVKWARFGWRGRGASAPPRRCREYGVVIHERRRGPLSGWLQTLARLIPPQPTEKTAVVVEQKGYRARRRDAGTNAPPRTRMSGGERRHKNCKGAVQDGGEIR
jgi:hypothetical protein